MPAIAFEEGARFHGQRFMQYVAFNMAGCAKLHLAGANTAFDAATNDALFGIEIADDHCLVTDHERGGADVAIHFAFDLHIAGRYQRAAHDQFAADDGRRPAVVAWTLGLYGWCWCHWSWFRLFTL